MKWHWSHIEWGEYAPDCYQFYFYWNPNWLGKDIRFIGVQRHWIDGPHIAFGFWFFNFSWSAYRSLPPFEFCNKATQDKWSKRPKFIQRLFGMEAYVAL